MLKFLPLILICFLATNSCIKGTNTSIADINAGAIVKFFTGPQNIQTAWSTFDNKSNLYITFSATGNFNYDGMSFPFKSSTIDGYLVRLDKNLKANLIMRSFGTDEAQFSRVEVDEQRNIYATIGFRADVHVQGFSALGFGDGNYDNVIIKFNPEGEILWTYILSGPDIDFMLGMAVDSEGNLLLTGYFADQITLDGVTYTSAGSRDILILKLDPNGKYLWHQIYAGPQLNQGQRISVDKNNNIYVAGFFNSSVVMHGEHISGLAGSDHAFYVKLDPDGKLIWKLIGTPSVNLARGQNIQPDDKGNVYIQGYYSSSMSLGRIKTITAASRDIYVAKVSASGKIIWFIDFPGAGNDIATSLEFSKEKGLLLWSYFATTISIENQIFNTLGGQDNIFAQINPEDGKVIFAEAFGSSGLDRPARPHFFDGHFHLAGFLTGTGSIRGKSFTTTNRDSFILKFKR